MTNYFKPNLVQIDGGLKLRTDLDALLNSYDAAKVLTTIKKEGDTGNYNVDELLTTLKTSLGQISGGSGTSLTSLKEAIDALEAKVVKDVVRLQLTATYANNAYTVTLPENIDTLVPGIDFAVKLPVFNLNNTSVFDATGAQLTFDFATKAFSGIPSELDEVASKNASDGKLIYKPLTVDFDFKVFPTGKFTLQTLPEGYLLDNNELQLIAYDQAINKLIIKLAQDKELIDDVKTQIGATAIKDQIDTAMAELTKAIADNKTATDKAISDAATATVAALDDKINKADIVSAIGDTPSANKVASEKAVADAIAAIKTAVASDSTDQINKAIADARKMIEDNVQTKTDAIATSVNTAITALTSRTKVFEIKDAVPVVEFVLDEVPNATKVTLNINSFVYEEEDGAFTVDRDNKKITWVATAANDGFDIMNTLTDKIIVRYFTGVATVNQVLNKVLSGTVVPTIGTYNVGDRIYKTNPVVGESEGWICTVAGTPGAWVEFGIIDIKSAISVEDVTV